MLFVSSKSPEGKSQLLDLETHAVVRTYKSDPQPSSQASCFNFQLNTVLLSHEKNCVSTYSVETQQVLQRAFMQEPIVSIASSPCQCYILGGGRSGCLYVWSAATGQLLHLAKSHIKSILCIAISLDSSLVATASEDSSCKIWHLFRMNESFSDASACVVTFSGHTLPIHACAFFSSLPWVVTASADLTSRIFDATTGAQMFSVQLQECGRSVCIFPNQQTIFVGGAKGYIHFYSLYELIGNENKERLLVVKPFEGGHEAPIVHSSIDQHGSSLIVASEDGVILLWNLSTYKVVKELLRVKKGICSATLIPDRLEKLKSQRVFVPMLSKALLTVESTHGMMVPRLQTDTMGLSGFYYGGEKQQDKNAAKGGANNRKRPREIAFSSKEKEVVVQKVEEKQTAKKSLATEPHLSEADRLRKENAELLEIANLLYLKKS